MRHGGLPPRESLPQAALAGRLGKVSVASSPRFVPVVDLTADLAGRRYIIVGDVHGCFDELQELLATLLPSHDGKRRDGETQVVLRQVRSYLMRKGPLLDFYHRSFWKAAQAIFQGLDTGYGAGAAGAAARRLWRLNPPAKWQNAFSKANSMAWTPSSWRGLLRLGRL